MEYSNNVLIVCTVIILLLIFLIFMRRFIKQKETMVNISPISRPVKWARDKSCNYKMLTTLSNALKNNSIPETDNYNKDKNNYNDDWVIFIPCTYNDIEHEISKIKPTKSDQRIFIVNNADQLTGKNNLWYNLVKTFGRDGASKLSPKSYILSNSDEMDLFNKEYDPTKIYILKKNIQRQEGLKITSDKKEIMSASNEGYVIVQEMLQDPYTINDRKINLRFYLLLVCQNNEISGYVHGDGFLYYTKMPFIKNSTKPGPNITTGYIERWVYDVNPLTQSDFKDYLNNKDRTYSDYEKEIINNNNNNNKKLSDIVFIRIYKLLADCIKAIKNTVCMDSHLKNYITFQLFGVDIALNDKLVPMIIEANKGPSLEPFDERDSIVKHNVVNDILKVLKVIPNKDNGYIKIYE